ncbi:MAG TPA: hypothetical protein VFG63_00890 [Nocardioidaceae bacterium]|nr:hypothetical protein [Nocardioidaceae bacterium]
MSGPNPPGDLPPDLPPEYAEAYRRGYQRAYEQGASEAEAEQTARLESFDWLREPEDSPAPPRSLAPSRKPTRAPAPTPAEAEDRRRKLLAPLVLIGLALVLILAAYGLGRVFSSEVGDTGSSSEPDGVVLGEDSGSASSQGGESSGPKTEQKKYDGQVAPVAIGGATASCQSDSSVDAAGHEVSYDPSNMFDGDRSTAWRCDGSGVGQKVTFTLPEETTIGEVGMVPGYAKTDRKSGADRYAENNRITRARWTFSDGSSVVQRLNGASGNRSMQTVRIPKTASDRVVVEILGTTRGPRNTVAISEVTLGEATG